MTHVLHINDNNLLIQRASTSVSELPELARSQGYAWLKGDQLLFDSDPQTAPVKFCRIAPQEINSRYWQQCAQSSIANNQVGMRHAADLIWAHIGELKKQHQLNELVLVVPSHYQSSNLQLLLGIGQSQSLTIAGLINKAVLALHDKVIEDGDYVHLDVQLHQTVSSTITVSGGIAKLGNIEVIQSVGIQAMQDALLKAIQAGFIQHDRFDPLHYAETEQQLFDQLNDSISDIARFSKTTISVQHQGQTHNTSIDAKLLTTTLLPFVQDLQASSHAVQQIYIDLNAAFGEFIPGAFNDGNFHFIEQQPVVDIASLVNNTAQADELVYLTQLPLVNHSAEPLPTGVSTSANSSADSTSLQKSVRQDATHLLQAGVAIPIEQAELRTANNQLTLHVADGQQHANAQTMLNQGQVFIMNDDARQQFQPNDRLGSHLADGVVTVIEVL